MKVEARKGFAVEFPVGLWALGLATLGVLGLAILTLTQLANNAALAERAAEAAARNRDSTVAAMGVLLAVATAETDQRAYLITHDPEYLRTFQADVQKAAQSLDSAAEGPIAELTAIRRAAQRRLGLLKRTAALEMAGRSAEVAKTVTSQGQPAMMDLRRQITALVTEIQAREAALQREGRRLDRRSRSIQAALASVTVLALLIGVISLGVERTTGRRAAKTQHLNQQLVEAQERADEASKAKSRFLATASHDMRQPLHALALYISLLDRRLHTEPERELLSNMDRAVRSMTRLFTALLDLARLEAGVLKAEVTEFALDGLLADVAEQSSDPRDAGGGRIRVASAGLHVRSDPDILEIVLRNLTSNALKYSNGGRVLLGCRRVGDTVRIEVHDTGPGIPPDQIQRLFSEFVRGEGATSKEGVGLGLSIVERMAELLGHKLSVRSQVGRGSVFSVTVPRATREAVRRIEGQPISLEGLSVLVADDQPLALDAMRRCFEDAGANAMTAPSAAAARRLADKAFDLFVFDLNLGGDSGLRLLEEMTRGPNGATPGLIVTGATTQEVLAELRDKGQAWITKPIFADELVGAAGRLLGRAP